MPTERADESTARSVLRIAGPAVIPRRMQHHFSARAALIVLALGLSACAYTPKHAETPAVTKLAGDATRGEPLYQTHCAACHGADLKGTEIGPSLTMRLAVYDDARIIDTVYLGRGDKMPPLGEVLTHQDISDVVAYLRAQP